MICKRPRSSDISDKSEPTIIPSRKSRRIESRGNWIPYLVRKYSEYVLMADVLPASVNAIKNREDRVHWEKAMKDEISSLIENRTWDIVPLPIGKNVIGCRWGFSIKYNSDGNPERYKARLVAQGFTQQYLLDYTETFAPVARMTSFRLIMSLAVNKNLHVHHMDVKTAFLNGDLSEEIYMRVPQGINNKDNLVCRLRKSIYGLKQAARCWFEKLHSELRRYGFVNSNQDCCVYYFKGENFNDNVYIILYVDDIIICTGNIDRLNIIKSHLSSIFQMVDKASVDLFLGITVYAK